MDAHYTCYGYTLCTKTQSTQCFNRGIWKGGKTRTGKLAHLSAAHISAYICTTHPLVQCSFLFGPHDHIRTQCTHPHVHIHISTCSICGKSLAFHNNDALLFASLGPPCSACAHVRVHMRNRQCVQSSVTRSHDRSAPESDTHTDTHTHHNAHDMRVRAAARRCAMRDDGPPPVSALAHASQGPNGMCASAFIVREWMSAWQRASNWFLWWWLVVVVVLVVEHGAEKSYLK